MGHQDRRPLEPLHQMPQPRTHRRPGADVQGGHGFVQQQQPGTDRQGTGQGHPLRLTSGQTPGPGRGVLGQPHLFQEPHREPSGLGPPHALAARAEGDVVQRAQVRQEQIVLEDDTDGAMFDGGGGQILPGQEHMPVGERGQPRQGAQDRGLAGPVGTEQGQDLPRRTGETDIEGELPPAQPEVGVEPTVGRRGGVERGSGFPCGHQTLIHLSRRVARTARETRSRTRLRTMAASGSRCMAM